MTAATPCTSSVPTECTNPAHDHFGQIEAAANGTGIDTGDDLLVCADCEAPMHYDRGDDNYHHDSPTAAACFLIRDEGSGTPCPHCDQAAFTDESGDCIHCGAPRPSTTPDPFVGFPGNGGPR